MANNHIFDYGTSGIEATTKIIKEAGIKYIGAGVSAEEIYSPYTAEHNGYKVGIISAAENGFGAAVQDEEYGFAYLFNEKISDMIASLKKICDLVIMVSHAGAEMWDYPLPEWRLTYHSLIDKGVDIIIGHHPHVPQGWEKYNNGLIFYSLGNFAFDKGKKVQDPESYAVLINVEDDNSVGYQVIPTIFSNGTVDINNDENHKKHLDKCCKILEDEQIYIESVNKKAIASYNSIYKAAYSHINSIYRSSLKDYAKGFVKRCILRQNFQDIWLYHNITIESHLYICKRASRLILKNKDIL